MADVKRDGYISAVNYRDGTAKVVKEKIIWREEFDAGFYIGYFGDVIFVTNDRRICTFNSMKRTISASYSEHNRYKKKSQREFEGPKNQSVSFKMKFVAGHGVRPWNMVHKITLYCEQGKICPFVIGGHKVGGGKWTIDSIDEDYREVWNRGELVSVEISVSATEYH